MLPHSGRRALRDRPHPGSVPQYERPDWILRATLERVGCALALDRLFLSADARRMFFLRYSSTAGRTPSGVQWFVDVFSRRPAGEELASLREMRLGTLTLSGPQLVDILGVARVETRPDNAGYLELNSVFRTHYLLPAIAE